MADNPAKAIPISINLSTSPEHSEDALALKFVKKHCHQFRYTPAHGRWSKWNGKLWVPDATPYVFTAARAICREDAKPCDLDLARKITSASTVGAIERLAHNDPSLLAEVDQWDANPWLLNTPKGVIDLRSGKLRPARPDDYMTKITAVGPSQGGCELWHKFLDKITNSDQELQAYLQRMCGYALTGITAEHALFFLYGLGGNGKGRFVYPLAGILGSYTREAPIEVFLDSQNDRHPTELAWLQGARLVTSTETEEGRRWDESKIKKLTGGDKIAARYMRQNFFEYTPQFKLLIQGNHKPGLRSVDEAMRRRFNLLPFTVTISPEERDKRLDEKLRPEWPGILQWAIEGVWRGRETDLIHPLR